MMKIITGRRTTPDAILLIGVEGVGKTKFASCAPSPVFICAEDGLGSLDVPRFEKPKTFGDVMQYVLQLRKEEHNYKTLVIDSLDWLEPLVWKAACEKYKWENIEAAGYGKGYVAANEFWGQLKIELDTLREAKGMQIILVAHTTIRTFNNPSGPDYSRFEPALARQASALWTQWADSVLFAAFEDSIRKDGNNTKAHSSGVRVAHTVRSPGWAAKSRWAIPPVIELDWDQYEAFRDETVGTDELEKQCGELLKQVKNEEAATKAAAFLETNSGNEKKLTALLKRLADEIEKQSD